MNSAKSLLLIVVAMLGLGLIACAEAQADSPCINGGYGWYGHGPGGVFEKPYAMGRIPTPPYFAIHPPVYYSHVVPRTYGYSPFAYPGTFRTPEATETKPVEIINPHVPEESTRVEPGDDQTAVVRAPLRIQNPFVERPLETASNVAMLSDD